LSYIRKLLWSYFFATHKLLTACVLPYERLPSIKPITSSTMRFFKLALASAGILAATSHAAPVEVRSSGLSGNTANTGSASVECGWFLKIEEDGPMPLYANGHIENVEEFTHMIGIFVETCGICMAFRYVNATNEHFLEGIVTCNGSLLIDATSERDGQGDILWSGGPGQDSGGTVRGAQSYYCIYGRQAGEVTDQIKNFPGHTVYGTPTGEAAWIIKNTTGHNAVAEAAETVKAVGACDTPTTTKVACGQYYNNQQQGPFDLFANGNYENLALGTTMTSARVDSCGICIVFRYISAFLSSSEHAGAALTVSTQWT
jgi:hypothetical protein